MWKRIVLCILALLLSFAGTMMAGKLLQREQESQGTITNVSDESRTRSIFLNKEVYKVGEPIYVTVNTYNPLDRVMVYRENEYTNRMAYWRVGALRDGEDASLLGAGVGNGTNVLDHMDANYSGSGDANFVPGSYAAVLLDYTGSFNNAVVKYVFFTVIE